MSNPNEPAYPTSHPTMDPRNPGWIGFGLTKREAFAMAAMQGLLAHNMQGIATAGAIAGWAVEQADALLSQLHKPASPAASGGR